MNIQQIKQLLDNRVSSVSNLIAFNSDQGNINEVVSLQNDLDETLTTLSLINPLLPSEPVEPEPDGDINE